MRRRAIALCVEWLSLNETFFQSQFAQVAVERYQLKLIVYEPVTEEIVQWIS